MDAKFIKELYENGFWYLYLVSLISSDTLLTVEDCERSMSQVLELEKVLPYADIPEEDKKKGMKYIERSKKIIERDTKELKKKEGN